MGRRKSEEAGQPVSIRISPELQTQLEHAAKMLKLSVHDVMRKCMRVGLKHDERIGWDEETAVRNAAIAARCFLMRSTIAARCVRSASLRAGRR